MKNTVQTFPVNELGRDFVIGDLHGAHNVFEILLDGIKFDKTVDRMFSVGDLVDRGPDSLKCLQLIQEPWFHAVLSNHEHMMLEYFRGGYMGQYWMRNGGEWAIEAVNDWKAKKNNPSWVIPDDSLALLDLIPVVDELPYLMTINTKAGKKFHVLHAELPPGYTITDEQLADPTEVEEWALKEVGDGPSFLWSRYLFGAFYKMNLSNKEMLENALKGKVLKFNPELSHIISGHTPVQKPLTIGGQTNIDTGAFMSYTSPYSTPGGPAMHDWAGLTCVELDTWKFYQATDKLVRDVTPVAIGK